MPRFAHGQRAPSLCSERGYLVDRGSRRVGLLVRADGHWSAVLPGVVLPERGLLPALQSPLHRRPRHLRAAPRRRPAPCRPRRPRRQATGGRRGHRHQPARAQPCLRRDQQRRRPEGHDPDRALRGAGRLAVVGRDRRRQGANGRILTSSGAPSQFVFSASGACTVVAGQRWMARTAPSPSLYDVLGLPTDADAEEIRSAYRRLARIYHPDLNHDPMAPTYMRRINEAYQVLSNPSKRAAYDAGYVSASNGAQTVWYTRQDWVTAAPPP